MKKSIVLLCMAIACAVMLTACGRGKGDGAASSPDISSAEENGSMSTAVPEEKPDGSQPQTEPDPKPDVQPETPPAEKPQENGGDEVPPAMPEGGDTAFGAGDYVVNGSNGDTLKFKNGALISHTYQGADGKGSYTQKDGTIGYSPYYGMTVEQAVNQMEQNGILTDVIEP